MQNWYFLSECLYNCIFLIEVREYFGLNDLVVKLIYRSCKMERYFILWLSVYNIILIQPITHYYHTLKLYWLIHNDSFYFLFLLFTVNCVWSLQSEKSWSFSWNRIILQLLPLESCCTYNIFNKRIYSLFERSIFFFLIVLMKER